MPTSTRDGATDDLRADLLEAARAVFADVGYHDASIDDVVRRAGRDDDEARAVFPAKEDVFLALLEPEALSLSGALTGLGAPTGDARADLHRVAVGIQTVVAIGTQGNLLFAEFRAHAAREPALAVRLAAVRQRVVAELARWLEDEAARLGVRLHATAHDTITVMLALVNGLSLEQVGLDGPAVGVDAIESVLRGLART